MTNEEAVEHLKVVLKTCDVQDEEAVEMAIAALGGKDINVPSKEEAIPVDWIETKMKRLKDMDNGFLCLAADILYGVLIDWRREQDGQTG